MLIIVRVASRLSSELLGTLIKLKTDWMKPYTCTLARLVFLDLVSDCSVSTLYYLIVVYFIQCQILARKKPWFMSDKNLMHFRASIWVFSDW